MADLVYGRDAAREIVIVGGGFGGVYAALELEKTLKREIEGGLVRLTLMARENFFLFTPMLHEVAASDVDPSHIVNPLHKLLKHTHVFVGEVQSVDLAQKRLCVQHGRPGHAHEHVWTYDDLILAPGSVAGFGGVPGAAQNALTMRTLGDAIALRNRLIESLELSHADCFAQMRAPLLTVVVAGGGFSGVETAGAVNDFLRGAVKHYRHLSPEAVRVVLVHSGERVLPELSEKLSGYAAEQLQKHGVEVRLQSRVASVEADCVVLSDGERIASHTLVWTVGNAPHPILETLPCLCERGRVRVNEHLELPEWPRVWALGDSAYAEDENGKPYPPTAQHALRQGKTVAHNVVASLRRTPQRAFRFQTLGQLATIGRRAGVAQMFGLQFSGFVAWWMWRTVYLSKLPSTEKKVRVALDWTLDLFFSKDLTPLSTPSGAQMGLTMDETPRGAEVIAAGS